MTGRGCCVTFSNFHWTEVAFVHGPFRTICKERRRQIGSAKKMLSSTSSSAPSERKRQTCPPIVVSEGQVGQVAYGSSRVADGRKLIVAFELQARLAKRQPSAMEEAESLPIAVVPDPNAQGGVGVGNVMMDGSWPR